MLANAHWAVVWSGSRQILQSVPPRLEPGPDRVAAWIPGSSVFHGKVLSIAAWWRKARS